MKKLTYAIVLVVLSVNFGYSQITSPTASSTQTTSYTNGSPNDNIYVFCSPQPTNPFGAPITGQLTSTPTGGAGPYTHTWSIYNTVTNSWDPYSVLGGATSTLTGLASGGYRVVITDGAGNVVGCQNSWVFVNQTTMSAGADQSGCVGFNLAGTANSVANFTYYNPPPDPFIIDASTTITVCVSANHTYVSDLGYYLVGPASCGSPTVILAPNPGSLNAANNVCNGSSNVNNLCFSTTTAAIFDVCAMGGGISGTYGGYSDGSGTNFSIDWSPLYGCEAAQGGWAVQIYDCIGGDVGTFTNADITISGTGDCGPATANYNSGAISSVINDNSCSSASASIFTVPPPAILSTPLTLANSINYSWSTNGGVGIPNPTTQLNQLIDPIPTGAVSEFHLSATDNFGCSYIDTMIFTNTCVTCVIDSMPVSMTSCYVDPGNFLLFDLAGTVYYTDPPTTGTLTITACDGQTVVLNPPFGTSSAFAFIGLPQGVGNCDFTAVFSAELTCTFIQGFMTPPPIFGFSLNCIVGGGAVNGDITYDDTYTSGTLIISASDGITTIDTIINLPAASP
ncbi:MAG: hypothetical protein JKY54_00300, partial [Flavobacteriales bacterium]|nr:hypothetical protein [Flavobacteriales bacterium]